MRVLVSKTSKARAALAERSATLNVVERRALIVSNGERSLDEIAGMLGHEAVEAVERLLRDGYLAAESESPRSTLDTALTMFKSARRAVENALPQRDQTESEPEPHGVAAAPAAAPQPAPAPTGPPPRAGNRRSLAASKMYVIGLLQLQRNADAVALAAHLQATRTPDEMMTRMLDAMRHIRATCNPSYVERISDRLAEILPEEYLPALRGDPPAAAGTLS